MYYFLWSWQILRTLPKVKSFFLILLSQNRRFLLCHDNEEFFFFSEKRKPENQFFCHVTYVNWSTKLGNLRILSVETDTKISFEKSIRTGTNLCCTTMINSPVLWKRKCQAVQYEKVWKIKCQKTIRPKFSMQGGGSLSPLKIRISNTGSKWNL